MSLCVSLCVSACVSGHPNIPMCVSGYLCVWTPQHVSGFLCVSVSVYVFPCGCCVCISVSLSLCEPVFLRVYREALHVSGSCVFVGAGVCEFTPPILTFSMPPLSGPSHFPVNPSPSRDPAASCVVPELFGSWELEQSRGANRRCVSPEPHRSQSLDPPTCPAGLALDLKLPIPDQAAKSPRQAGSHGNVEAARPSS